MDLPDSFIHHTTRYVLGRATYVVSTHCKWLVDNWDDIPVSEREIIIRDVEEAFERDDKFRADATTDPHKHTAFGPLGMAMDRAEWERVRARYQQQPAPAKKGSKK